MLHVQMIKNPSGELHRNPMSWTCLIAQRCHWLAEVTRLIDDVDRLCSAACSVVELIWSPGHQEGGDWRWVRVSMPA